LWASLKHHSDGTQEGLACKHRNCKAAVWVNALAPAKAGAALRRPAGETRSVSVSDLTMQPDPQGPDLGGSPLASTGAVQLPNAEDEGLSVRQIKWLPLAVPLAALTMLLGAAAVLSTA